MRSHQRYTTGPSSVSIAQLSSHLAKVQDPAGTLAITAQTQSLPWGRGWPEQPQQQHSQDYYMMSVAGLNQPQHYDTRALSAASMPRSLVASQYISSSQPMSFNNMSGIVGPSPIHQATNFSAQGYQSSLPQSLPNYNNNPYPPPRVPQQSIPPPLNAVPLALNYRLSYPHEQMKDQIVPIKNDPAVVTASDSWNMRPLSQIPPNPTSERTDEVEFKTDVDLLMKAIQSRNKEDDQAEVDLAEERKKTAVCFSISRSTNVSIRLLPKFPGN